MAPNEMHSLPLDDSEAEAELLRPSRLPRLHRMHLAGAGALVLTLVLLDPFMTAWIEDFKASLTLGLSGPAMHSEPGVNLAPTLSNFLPAQTNARTNR